MKKLVISCLFLSGMAFGQQFTKQDTLKGSNTEFRNFWDVKKYELTVEPNFETKALSGTNKISLEIVKDVLNPTFQIDLQQPMNVDKIKCSFATIDNFKRDGDFIFIQSKGKFKKGPLEIHEPIGYTDFALKKFFETAKKMPW